MWWLLKHGLVGWVLLSLVWGVLTIVYDFWIEFTTGNEFTISWQVQVASHDNPVIPTAVGFIVGGLAIHFWKVRESPWFRADQPIWFYAAGFTAGAILVALSWTQRG